MRVRVPREARAVRFFMSRWGKVLLGLIIVIGVAAISVITYFYITYAHIIDAKLRGGPFVSTSQIYAAPTAVGVGEVITPAEIENSLRRAGYTESRNNTLGYYELRGNEVLVFPGTESYFGQDAGTIHFTGNKITKIVSLKDNTERSEYRLEPQLITNLYDRNREKRRYVKYADIPPVLLNAVLSAEDRRFFQHAGFDPIGIARAALVDLKERRNKQGASTISQQLARGIFLTTDRNWRRKVAELMITVQLEQKLSKKEIFELYCNQIDLGRRGSFTIRGFGEAADAYFGKDLRYLSVAEAATLAGMLRGASYYNPFRHPDRVKDRRNVVLQEMLQNGHITDREYALAVDTPLKLAPQGGGTGDAPYFVDMVNDELQNRFENYDFQAQSYKIYTSLDPRLQRAANDAVKAGMQQVDELLAKQKRHKGVTFPEAQVAMIVLDPHTGEIKALVGGRNYGQSQLNHVLAKRQPGSIFKPFVYAAAMNSALGGSSRTLTPATTVVDEPTTFWFDNKPYQPGNFEHEFLGTVTLRRALAKSLNVATIKVAEMVGYGTVVNLAHRAGINEDVRPTPSMAIGSYEATPLEMSGAYTVFANDGVYVKPTFLDSVREQGGAELYSMHPETKNVLDRRSNYLTVSMLEEVMRTGTAAGVRARGFTVPAAGKTGTSHDGWFAGFTSQLLCIVWVGFDDNRELNLEGAHSALPIWTDFMKKALQFREYRNAHEFPIPDGVVSMQIDAATGQPPDAFTITRRNEVFIAGTEPVSNCPLDQCDGGQNNSTTVSGWDTTTPAVNPISGAARPATPYAPPAPKHPIEEPPPTNDARKADAQEFPPSETTSQSHKKKGFLGRIFGHKDSR
jgi:penicillin-binding protein 1B